MYNISENERSYSNLENDTCGTNALTITVKQLASLLKISMPTAYELVRKKSFPSFRIGKKVLISVSGLKQWIDDQTSRRVKL